MVAKNVRANDLFVLNTPDLDELRAAVSNGFARLLSMLEELGIRVGTIEDIGWAIPGDDDGDGLPDKTLAKIEGLVAQAKQAAESALTSNDNVQRKMTVATVAMTDLAASLNERALQTIMDSDGAKISADAAYAAALKLLQSAEAARDIAIVAQTAAQQGASSAQTSATQASIAAGNSAESAAQALISQLAAAESASESGGSAGAAAASAAQALTYANDSEAFSLASETSKLESEAAAGNSAAAALASADSATQSLSYSNDALAYSQASQNSQLVAEAQSEFSYYTDVAPNGAYTFDDGTVQSWSGSGSAAVSNITGKALRITGGGANPLASSPIINFNGSKYNKVRLRFKVVIGSLDGTNLQNFALWYTTSSRTTFSSTYKVVPKLATITEPDTADYYTALFDVTLAGSPVQAEWSSSTIRQIAIVPAGNSTIVVDVDYVYILSEDASAIYAAAEVATTKAAEASSSAAFAEASTIVAARMSQGSPIVKNPLFQDWPSAYPEGYYDAITTGGNNINKETSDVRYGSNALRFDIVSPALCSIALDPDTGIVNVNEEYVVIDFEAQLMSGVATGLGITFSWVCSSPPGLFTVSINLADMQVRPDPLGTTTISYRKVVKRPIAYTGSFDSYGGSIIGNGANGGDAANKVVVVHKYLVRSATAEEIRTFNVGGEIAAAVAVEQAARVAADGTIEAKYTVKVDIGGYVTGYGLIATANDGVIVSTFDVLADNLRVFKPGASGPQQMFDLGTVNGVNKMVLKGDFYADGSISANAISVIARNKVNDPSQSNSQVGWTFPADWSIQAVTLNPPTDPFDLVVRMPSTAAVKRMDSDWFDIDPNKTYRITCSFKDNRIAVGATGNSILYVQLYDGISTNPSVSLYNVTTRVFSSAVISAAVWNGSTGGVWRHVESYIVGAQTDPKEVPKPRNTNTTGLLQFAANARKMRFVLMNNNSAGGAVTLDMANITVTEVGSGLIEASQLSVTDLSAISANLGSIVVDNAHIGNLSVDTINIVNSAVTAQASAVTAGTITLTTSYQDLVSVTVTPNAGKMEVKSYFYLDTNPDSNNFTKLVYGDFQIDVQFLRGATVLETQNCYIQGYWNASDDPSFGVDSLIWFGNSVFALLTLDNTPGTTSVIYKTRAKWSSPTGNTLSPHTGWTLINRSISVNNFKK